MRIGMNERNPGGWRVSFCVLEEGGEGCVTSAQMLSQVLYLRYIAAGRVIYV